MPTYTVYAINGRVVTAAEFAPEAAELIKELQEKLSAALNRIAELEQAEAPPGHSSPEGPQAAAPAVGPRED